MQPPQQFVRSLGRDILRRDPDHVLIHSAGCMRLSDGARVRVFAAVVPRRSAFRIKIDALFIPNDELFIQNDELCVKHDELSAARSKASITCSGT